MSRFGGPGDSGHTRLPSRWRAELVESPPPAGAERLTVVRLIPVVAGPGERFGQRGSAEDVLAQLEEVRALLLELDLDARSTMAIAPAGWLYQPWPLALDAGLPAVDAECVAARVDAEPYLVPLAAHVDTLLGVALAALPVRYTIFGADFTNYDADRQGWELDAMFVFKSGAARTQYATSKFASSGSWRSWLLATHRWESHYCRLDGIGSALLLDCHDLISLASSRSEPKGHLKERRKAVRRLIEDKKPATLVHIAHSLATPATWPGEIDGLQRLFPTLKRAASVARYARFDADGRAHPPLSDYAGLVRGFRDIVIALHPQ